MNDKIALGKDSLYPDRYDASLLVPIPRSDSRSSWLEQQPNNSLPFGGVDIWTAYELSWLDDRGKPHVRVAEFAFPCESHAIIESKSFKYYLNSFNQSAFASDEAVIDVLEKDLSAACGAQVSVVFRTFSEISVIESMPGVCVDDIDIDVGCYDADASLLQVADEHVQQQRIFSNLLKSNCPVTGQPDWASIWVEYSGPHIVPESFLRYVVSFRQHQDFHENCVERIFNDISLMCGATALSIYARYTRRGGLDINPYRTNGGRKSAPFGRVFRQ